LRWLLPFPKTEQNTDFGDPARWKNAIVRRRLQFLAAVIDGEGQHVSERIGQEEEIYPTSAHRLAPEQARAMLAAKDLREGPVIKQLLDWIAELEGRPRPDKK